VKKIDYNFRIDGGKRGTIESNFQIHRSFILIFSVESRNVRGRRQDHRR
jgi:hypothetical protein